ncbi:MAG: IS3 family transposase, partial [Paracoccaceae bacterium]
ARMRHAGVRTGPRRVLRVMRDHGLPARQRAGSPRGPRAHDGAVTTKRVDGMWGTGMTGVATGEGPAAVLLAADRRSAACVGIHASARATRHEAPEPIRQAVRRSFGAVGAKGLKVRHDHGSRCMSRDFQREIRFLGAESSPAFARAPEGDGCRAPVGDGCAARFIRTLKETLPRVRRFDTIEALRPALLAFQRTCNEPWLVERHGHRPPAAIRRERTMNMQRAA